MFLNANVKSFGAMAVAGLVASASACSCEDTSPVLSRLSAEIELTPETLDFGNVPVGARSQKAINVTNPGSDKLSICVSIPAEDVVDACTQIYELQPTEAPFALVFETFSETGKWSVEPAESREFIVTFSPVMEGEVSATIKLYNNSTNLPEATIQVLGNGVPPELDLSGTVFDFSEVTVSKRKELALTLTNPTVFDQPFSIDPVEQASIIFGYRLGINDTPHDQPLTGVVPANGSIEVQIWYQPPEEGAHEKTTTLKYCENCLETLTLKGVGVKPVFAITPSSIDFGDLDEGQLAEDSFRVQNIGNHNVTVSAIGLEAGTSQEFTATPDSVMLPHVLAPSEEMVVNVSYTGVTPGEDLGRVQVDTDAWDDPMTPVSESVGYVDLSARSVGPDINPLPASVQFGTVQISGTPKSMTLLIENVGNADLNVSDIQLDTMSTEITIANSPGLPVVIAPGASEQITLVYAPIDAGMDMGTLVITSDDRDEGILNIPVAGIGGVPTTCAVSVAPSQLTFGLVERGSRVVLPVEIRNSGAMPCNLSSIMLNGAPEFVIESGEMTTGAINPGQAHQVVVAYQPMDYGQHATLLEFMSDDPSQMMLSVPINGTSAPTDIRVIPSQLDFNVVPVGTASRPCRSPERTVTVYNTGSNQVTVTDVSLDLSTSPEFELQPFTVPANIPAGDSVSIGMRYKPVDIGTDTGVLFITVDLGSQTQRIAVPLSGDGQLNPTVTDTFQQLANPKADVLFVVDNSCSMREEQNSLGSNLGSFLTFATQQGIDFQLGVTTTDVASNGEAGRFVEEGPQNVRIITPNTPNGSAAFSSNVNLGTSGSADEQGLEAAYLALKDPLINTWNAGFLRTDAALAVIAVSDEPDHSSRTVNFYENFLRNIKGFQNSGMFSFSAIVGTQTGGCNGPGGDAQYAPRYIQVAQNTGGVVESICNANWGQTLANIGLNSFGLKRQFVLSSAPVASTISVDVNGTTIPSVTPGGATRWTYDTGTNSIIFQTGSVPEAGATISITYSVQCL